MKEETKEVSGEEFQRMQSEAKFQKPNFITAHRSVLVPILVLVVVAGFSFGAGIQYQKGKKVASVPTTTAASQFGPSDGSNSPRSFRGGAGASIGQVKAVSSTSITVTNDRTGTDTTLAITSTTVVTNAGATAAVSDIKVGDTVFAQAATNDANTATRIMINPTMGGAQYRGDAPSGTTDSDTQAL
jgi:hypothetical protein